MKSFKLKVLVVGLALQISGCAGVGIVETSSPLNKLADAEYLIKATNRVLPAEKLIWEAIAIYQESNDLHGLGNAYRTYSELLKSKAISVELAKYYQTNGFRDKSVTFDNRIAKSQEYFAKAFDYYLKAEQPLREAKRFDALTNLFWNLGHIYVLRGEGVAACTNYDKSLEAFNENIRLNPTVKPRTDGLNGTFPEAIAKVKKSVNCSD